MSKNGVTLKPMVGVVQGHRKWRRSIDPVRLYIGKNYESKSKSLKILYYFGVTCISVMQPQGNIKKCNFKLFLHKNTSEFDYFCIGYIINVYFQVLLRVNHDS